MSLTDASDQAEASRQIDERIAELGDWRGALLAEIRKVVLSVDPGIEEQWKWRGVPTWSLGGIICTGETYKDKVKVTFVKGASLADPQKVFNASLDGNVRRAIDFGMNDLLQEDAFAELVKAAIDLNLSKKKK